MFRTAFLRAAHSAAPRTIIRPAAIARSVQSPRFLPTAFQAVRVYSAAAGLNKEEVEGRIVDLLRNFDKVSDPVKEFSIEIPDKHADTIHSVDKAVEYILAQPDAH